MHLWMYFSSYPPSGHPSKFLYTAEYGITRLEACLYCQMEDHGGES